MPDTASKSVELADIISMLFANCQIKENIHASQFGVSIVEFRCLRILYRNADITVNQLAKKMSLTSSRITRIVDGLVKKDFVHRISGKNDRRIYHLSLSRRGKLITQDMIERYVAMHEEILSTVPVAEQKEMLRFLHSLNKAVTIWLNKQD